MKVLYTAAATATGGRNGQVKSDNGVLDLQVRMPRALGGQDDLHTNPEQLFAAGYAACFDSALNRVIKLAKAEAGETTVAAKVSIGQLDNGGFGLAVELAVTIPGVNAAQAQELVEQAHAICPYSNATRNNINVKLTVNS